MQPRASSPAPAGTLSLRELALGQACGCAGGRCSQRPGTGDFLKWPDDSPHSQGGECWPEELSGGRAGRNPLTRLEDLCFLQEPGTPQGSQAERGSGPVPSGPGPHVDIEGWTGSVPPAAASLTHPVPRDPPVCQQLQGPAPGKHPVLCAPSGDGHGPVAGESDTCY